MWWDLRICRRFKKKLIKSKRGKARLDGDADERRKEGRKEVRKGNHEGLASGLKAEDLHFHGLCVPTGSEKLVH